MQSSKLQELIKQTKNLNVLYVEDNIEVQTQTTKMLKSFFNNISIANNGKTGIELFTNNPDDYHIILTDIKMPISDGITMIEGIRKLNKTIPILILSAHDDKNYFLKTINHGIDGYILKPYTLEQITTALLNIVEKYNFNLQFNETDIFLDFDFTWNKKCNQLTKDNQLIKLSKNEIKLFQLFTNDNSIIKSYKEIEFFVFGYSDEDMKKIRNLISRLKIKLDYDLFETIYGHGYSLRYKYN